MFGPNREGPLCCECGCLIWGLFLFPMKEHCRVTSQTSGVAQTGTQSAWVRSRLKPGLFGQDLCPRGRGEGRLSLFVYAEEGRKAEKRSKDKILIISARGVPELFRGILFVFWPPEPAALLLVKVQVSWTRLHRVYAVDTEQKLWCFQTKWPASGSSFAARNRKPLRRAQQIHFWVNTTETKKFCFIV